MKCEEVVEWMHRYLDHDLGEAETAQMLQHVAQCPECAENFSLLRALSRELEDLPQVTPKFSLVDAIMPQLDAIDEAKREQSSTIQEMSPVPAAFENLQRSSERKPKQKWLNTMVGRMSMGAAAAAVVLGIAVWGYQPEKIENADSMMMSSGSAQESGNTDQNALKREINNSDDSSSSESTSSSPLMDNPENQPSLGEEDKNPEAVPEENGSEQVQEPEVKDNPTPKQPASDSESNKSGESEDASSGSDSTHIEKNLDQGQDSQQKNQDPGSATVPPASPDETSGTETDSGEPESFVSQNLMPDSKGDEPTEEMTNPDSETGTEAPSGNRGIAGPDQSTTTTTATPKEWKSPDGSYLVMLIGNQLSVYSKSANEPDVLNLVEQRDLEGTLKSASWSQDSTLFNYETDKDGTTVKNSFTVPSASGETSAK